MKTTTKSLFIAAGLAVMLLGARQAAAQEGVAADGYYKAEIRNGIIHCHEPGSNCHTSES